MTKKLTNSAWPFPTSSKPSDSKQAAVWPFPTGNQPGPGADNFKSAKPPTKTASKIPTKMAGPVTKRVTVSSKSRWTAGEINLLAKLYVQGYKPEQIAAQLGGRSTKAIVNQLMDWKTKKTPTGARLGAAITVYQATNHVSHGPATKRLGPVTKAAGPATKASPKAPTKAVPSTPPANHRASWTVTADHQLLRGYGEGMTPSALAAFCGRTKSAVAGRLHALGVLTFDNVAMEFKTKPKVWLKVAASKA